MRPTSLRVAVSNTGPLISALQSNCMHILQQFYDQIHIPVDEIIELQKHGAGQEISRYLKTGFMVVHEDFTLNEIHAAKAIAREIADHRATRDRNPANHLPEAFAIVLVQRSRLGAIELLIDELAARDVARLRKVPLIGFPGILIRACRQSIIVPDEAKSALEECQRQGTHYSPKLINGIYSNLKRL